MSIHEECGVFGVYSEKETDVAGLSYYGLYALQHRGQESCGIVVNKDGLFYSHKNLGLVSEVFSENILESLPVGNMAVAHVRYGTTGATNRANIQPIEVNHQKGRMALAHNGNLSNAYKLRSELEMQGAIFHTTSDTETIAYYITRERIRSASIEEAVEKAMKYLEGAYSLVIMSAQKLICVRDSLGFRPLCYGRTADGTYIVASESCALRAVGAKLIRDVEPGEILVFYNGEVRSIRTCGTVTNAEGTLSDTDNTGNRPGCRGINEDKKKICVFEYIYFARPDSIIDGVSVHASRVRAGKILAEEHPADADIVIGAPDSGLDAALGFSEQSGIPYRMGFIKNKYIGRTFISPTKKTRVDGVKIKLAVLDEVVRDKRVVLVDDSIVRGTTMGRVVKLLRDAGAKEVHVRISSPPFLHPCYYGTDIDSEKNLVACHHTIPEICDIIGADSLGYFPVERLGELTGGKGYCDACFTGGYPTTIPDDSGKDRFEQPLKGSIS
ncbi:MAG: amidophosphoribosyltransferase [Lachnospiraceae bacterium]|nr:amidophosphoribosyltransferase [Lachnospiraceae bacterium]